MKSFAINKPQKEAGLAHILKIQLFKVHYKQVCAIILHPIYTT